LRIVVLGRRDAERGANRGASAVRADHEPRTNRARAGLDPRFGRVAADLELRDGRGCEHTEAGRALEPLPERLSERRVLDRVAEGLDALLLRPDPRGAEAAALGNVHGSNRLGAGSELGPDAEGRENSLRRVRERGGPAVEARLLELRGLARLDEHHVERQLGERAGERGADGAAADDQHVAVETLGEARAHARVAISASISSTEAARSAVSTSGPSRVTSTSSSIRMPIPRQRFATSLFAGDT
jgi:hypothetical protein